MCCYEVCDQNISIQDLFNYRYNGNYKGDVVVVGSQLNRLCHKSKSRMADIKQDRTANGRIFTKPNYVLGESYKRRYYKRLNIIAERTGTQWIVNCVLLLRPQTFRPSYYYENPPLGILMSIICHHEIDNLSYIKKTKKRFQITLSQKLPGNHELMERGVSRRSP